MIYSIVFYCPDVHLEADKNTIDSIGIGGGITARLRVAHALAQIGHNVSLYVNSSKEKVIDGVQYKHFSSIEKVDTDVFIAASSGGAIDLKSIGSLNVKAELKLLMVHSADLPWNVNPGDFDFIYILSNFVRNMAEKHWPVDPRKFFVVYHGVADENFPIKKMIRDPYSMVYFSHPSKGLDSAIWIFRKLKEMDQRYSLHIYGGNQLWGGEDVPIVEEEGLYYHGMLGQVELAKNLQGMEFSLNLQAREEPFGMVITESMRAGCIVIASQVGAFTELIHNGYNGFLVSGDHNEEKTIDHAVSLISTLNNNAGFCNFIRRNAIHTPLSWRVIAKTWEEHWDWFFDPSSIKGEIKIGKFPHCSSCTGELLLLSDGMHCISCGSYFRSFDGLVQ
ncbi:glycosyltransferase family 4 protein [Chloroflexota bacterium]